MSVFRNYAAYYDAFYADKDYRRESAFIDELIRSRAQNTHSILDLGCGTGSHALLLAERGYRVHGVERSAEMLDQAADRLKVQSKNVRSTVEFTQGDIRSIRLSREFDAVISLFHVVSYQTTNQDLQKSMRTVREHTKLGGVFIFDFWYGPAVLTDPPQVRVKKLTDGTRTLHRIAQPETVHSKNVVDIHYLFLELDGEQGVYSQFEETHRMRYLFGPEIEELLTENGFRLETMCDWLTAAPASSSSWNAHVVARREA